MKKQCPRSTHYALRSTPYALRTTRHALRLTLFLYFLLPTSHFLLFGIPPDTAWSRTYGGTDIDVAYSVCQTADGGYIATGYTSSFGAGQQDAYLVRINSTGDTAWTRTFGGASMDGAHFVRETSDHGYVIAGYTESYGNGKNVYLIKADSIGQAEWTRLYGTNLMDVAYAFCETPESGYMFVGYKNGPSGWAKGDLWILKTAATIICDHLSLPDLRRFSIYDIPGRKVPSTSLAPGVYFIESQGNIIKKVVKVR